MFAMLKMQWCWLCWLFNNPKEDTISQGEILGGEPEFDGVRSLVAAVYAHQLMTQALNYRYKICRYVMYNVCIFIYRERVHIHIHVYIYLILYKYIFLQYRQKRMYDFFKWRKKSWAPKIMVPHFCWRRVWYVKGASCKLSLVCLVE